MPRARGDHPGQPTNIARRIGVCVAPVATRTDKKRSTTRPKALAVATGFAGVRRVNVLDNQASTFRLVRYKSLQLPKCPPMQPSAYCFASANPSADMGQVFHHDDAPTTGHRFGNNLFAHHVVFVPHTAFLLARDLAKALHSALRAVGLETPTQGGYPTSSVTQKSAALDLASASGGKNILADIYTQRFCRLVLRRSCAANG